MKNSLEEFNGRSEGGRKLSELEDKAIKMI